MKAALLVLLAACGSYSTYKTTRIAPTDRTQWLFAAQASGTIFPDNGGGAPLPEAAIGVRRGLTDRIEIQATGTLLPISALETGSLELAGKLRGSPSRADCRSPSAPPRATAPPTPVVRSSKAPRLRSR